MKYIVIIYYQCYQDCRLLGPNLLFDNQDLKENMAQQSLTGPNWILSLDCSVVWFTTQGTGSSLISLKCLNAIFQTANT